MLSTTDDEGIVRIYKRTFSRFRLESTAIKKTLTPDSYVRKKLESPGIIGGGRTALGRRLEWALKVFREEGKKLHFMFNMYSEFTLDKKACTLRNKSIANVPKLESIKKKR